MILIPEYQRLINYYVITHWVMALKPAKSGISVYHLILQKKSINAVNRKPGHCLRENQDFLLAINRSMFIK